MSFNMKNYKFGFIKNSRFSEGLTGSDSIGLLKLKIFNMINWFIYIRRLFADQPSLCLKVLICSSMVLVV